MSSDDVVSQSAPYVAAGTPQTGDAWAREAASTGGKGTQRILYAGIVDPPADVAAMLNLHPGDRVIARRRLVLLDGRPVELADAHWPLDVADGTPLGQPGKIPGGSVRILRERGYIAAHVHEEINARICSDEEQGYLEITPGEPVLILRRASYTADGMPFEAAVMTMRAAGRTLAYNLGTAA